MVFWNAFAGHGLDLDLLGAFIGNVKALTFKRFIPIPFTAPYGLFFGTGTN